MTNKVNLSKGKDKAIKVNYTNSYIEKDNVEEVEEKEAELDDITDEQIEVVKDEQPILVRENRRSRRYKAPSYVVTKRQFKTKKKTYNISKIEKTEIRRNLIFFFPMSILSLIFTHKFWDYLYTDEVIFIIAMSIILGIASISLGTLYVYSKALGEPALFNFIPILKRVRYDIDEVMFDLEEQRDKSNGDYIE